MYFFLKTPKCDKSTPINLIYYVKSQGKNFKYSTGQQIHPNNWDFSNRLPQAKRGASGVKAKHLVSILSQYTDLLEDSIRDCERKNITCTRELLRFVFDENFKHKKSNRGGVGLVDAIQSFVDTKNKSKGQSKSWSQKYINLKSKLECFERSKKRKIHFEDITQDWLGEYCGYLRNIDVKPFQSHNDNTLNRNIKFLFTVLIWAKGKYHNLNLSELKNPVKNYQPMDVSLTSKEVGILEKLKLPTDSLNQVRDLFLIGVYSGQRFSDYSVFEKADLQGDMIIKVAEKTEMESYIPLHTRLRALLDKYDWELPKFKIPRFNRNIQKICELAGINEQIKEITYTGAIKKVSYHPKFKMVSSHTARRTFITLSCERGMPDHVIMKITGIRSFVTLIKYKKTSQNSIIESMNKYWG